MFNNPRSIILPLTAPDSKLLTFVFLFSILIFMDCVFYNFKGSLEWAQGRFFVIWRGVSLSLKSYGSNEGVVHLDVVIPCFASGSLNTPPPLFVFFLFPLLSLCQVKLSLVLPPRVKIMVRIVPRKVRVPPQELEIGNPSFFFQN